MCRRRSLPDAEIETTPINRTPALAEITREARVTREIVFNFLGFMIVSFVLIVVGTAMSPRLQTAPRRRQEHCLYGDRARAVHNGSKRTTAEGPVPSSAMLGARST